MPSTFELKEAMQVLERTPGVLRAMLTGLSENWITADEGPDTWNPYDIVGHLVVGEQTDWVTRTGIILEHGRDKPFEPFDRFLQFEQSRGKSLDQLLDEFEAHRRDNLVLLRDLLGPDPDYARTGIHPAFGDVTLGELLSTWVVHDLGHIAQVARVMAKRYRADVGPWVEYLPILSDR